MKKILIVDDDVDIIDLVTNRLKRAGYEVVFANDGTTGIKKAVTEKPDLIIMDVMMPKMQGGDAVKHLQSSDDTKNIPVMFFTAMNAYLPSSLELGKINVGGTFYPAIAKPFEPDKLMATIKSLLGE